MQAQGLNQNLFGSHKPTYQIHPILTHFKPSFFFLIRPSLDSPTESYTNQSNLII